MTRTNPRIFAALGFRKKIEAKSGNISPWTCRILDPMKLTGPFLVLLAWPTGLLADSPESSASASAKASAHVSAMIRADLPGFVPRTDPASPQLRRDEATVARDPDVLELPKITVRERPPPKIDPLDILVKAGRKKKLAHDFKESFTGLDALLNGFSFPLFSPTMAERGRVYHQQQQLEELNRVGGAVRESDPKAAAGLAQDAAAAQRALDRQNRPAGVK